MALSRRRFVKNTMVSTGASALAIGAVGGLSPSFGLHQAFASGSAGWPSAAAWAELNARVGGRLIEGRSPLAACVANAADTACAATLEDLQNPFFIEDQPGGHQTTGWLDAWTPEVSPYAVAAESAADIAASVDFARDHAVKLVIKGTGHDYLGRNCAPDSLLIWTHGMRAVAFHEAFRVAGAPASDPGVAAVSAEAGARWIDAYKVASANDRYVQGGGCTTVGVAGGFIQGGGYGSLSKRFGTGAGSVLEYEVVTADGGLVIANAVQNTDLFWALRGGGGGTFGVVTKVTLRAHERPTSIGMLSGTIRAPDDAAFGAMIERFVAFYPDALNNPTWGEQIAIRADNSFELFMTFLDIDEDEALATWAQFTDGLPDSHQVNLTATTHPFSGLWDLDYWRETDPDFVTIDERPNSGPDLFWWALNQGEVSSFLDTYQSRWLPIDHFAPANAATLTQALFDASRHADLRLQINKGLSGTTPDVLARERETSVNPVVHDAAAIVILTSRQALKFPGIAGHEPDIAQGRNAAAEVETAIDILRDATPGGGTYASEADYFEPDWQRSFYGAHYDRLLEIKRRYDPTNLFCVHHGVGSER